MPSLATQSASNRFSTVARSMPPARQRRHLPSLSGSTGRPRFGRPCAAGRPPLDVSSPLEIPRATIAAYVRGRELLLSGFEAEEVVSLGKGPDVGTLTVCGGSWCCGRSEVLRYTPMPWLVRPGPPDPLYAAWGAGRGPRDLQATPPRKPSDSRFASNPVLSRGVDLTSRRRGTLIRGRACSGLLEAGFGLSEVRPQVGQHGFPGWPTGGSPRAVSSRVVYLR